MTDIKTLQKQIKDMGIKEDDTVVIHSSLRAVGKTENGADGIIDAFCGYLKNGLFIVPTHTWATVTPGHPVFCLNESVPCVGTLPTVAAKRKDGIRSCHPTHSVMAFGKRAAEYVAGEEFAETPTPVFGCWGRLKDEKAKILLAGVGLDKNTFIHSIDEAACMPDRLMPPRQFTVYDANGVPHNRRLSCHHCSKTGDVSHYFTKFEKLLYESGALKYGSLVVSKPFVCEADKVLDAVLPIFVKAARLGVEICCDDRDIGEILK